MVEANDTLLERVDKILDMLRQDKNENKLEVQQKSSKNVGLCFFRIMHLFCPGPGSYSYT